MDQGTNTSKNVPKKASRSTTSVSNKSKGFTNEEKSLMKARVREMRADLANGEAEVLERIAQMPEPDRTMATRIHAIIKANAPSLIPRLWYSMPAYAKDGNVICHFQDAHKFKMRYATLGFSDKALLDEGIVWPVAFALKDLNPTAEARIAALVKKAVG